MYIVGGIAVAALVVWSIYAAMQKNSSQPATQQQSSNNPKPKTTNSTAPTAPAAKSAVKKLAYGDAVKEYKNRFQFASCHGSPGTMVIKKGGIVMLDNRDASSHSIKLGSQTFKIVGYDYALYYSPTIGKINITCDGGGAAVLNVEK